MLVEGFLNAEKSLNEKDYGAAETAFAKSTRYPFSTSYNKLEKYYSLSAWSLQCSCSFSYSYCFSFVNCRACNLNYESTFYWTLVSNL